MNQNEAAFLKAFSYEKNCQKPKILKFLIKILHNLIKSQEVELASRILGQVFSSEGEYQQFSSHVDFLLKKAPIERDENLLHLLYIAEIGLFGIERSPKTIYYFFPKAVLIQCVKDLQKQGKNVRILLEKCQELEKQFDLFQDQARHPPAAPTKKKNPDDDLEPPDNFALLEILPQIDDLKSGPNFRPFLRSNIIKGKYRDWDHYLDVQFRLLREDFIAPLRDGIKCHYEGVNPRNTDIYLYKHVQVLTPVCLFTGLGFQIHFDTHRLQRVNWEHSRRLIFGSLLCLSKDDFDSFIFATVAKRDPKELNEGYLTVQFEGSVNGFDIDSNETYLMAESTAYYEAYRHVLLGLQNTAKYFQDTMPFKRYIIDCNVEAIPPPLCIRLAGPKFLQANSLASCNLDTSQEKAMKMALRQEISVIQGPPGTGKTFIGLKLMEAFLQNRVSWDPGQNSPILVICYTNHALDQFLEGIYDLPHVKPNIVRVGGRCKTEKLDNCVLAQKVKAARLERSLPRGLHKRNIQAHDRMNASKLHLNQLQENFNPAENKLLSLTRLEEVVSPLHYHQLTQGMPTETGKEIEVWLGLWYPASLDEENHITETASEHNASGFAVGEHSQDASGFAVGEHSQDTSGFAAGVGENESEEQFIDVDREAQLLQDARMLEGEEIELPEISQAVQKPEILQAEKEQDKRQDVSRGASGWKTVQISDKERKKRIQKGFQYEAMQHETVQTLQDIRQLKVKERWQLYHYWISQYLETQKVVLKRYADHYNANCSVYTETKQEIDCYVARGADIIGMTTTGAAKHRHLLKDIHPRIVIIEEAAEVFESHIVTSLSPSVQQLILIGDHKQLRPKPNSYSLQVKYNLDVSLFERLINNGIFHVSLEVQHRMRPEIASLICPAIYDKLENAPKVETYDRVKGVGHNLFFIDHFTPEECRNPEDVGSHVNVHEAMYMAALCRYLLKQGYKQSQITLLTMYKGQLLEMKRRMRRTEFGGVRVAAVDDFQGEENDIILLSLVRSNSDKKIGFLKTENRICVSLSRARMGLYVIGNFTLLEGAEKTKWPEILSQVRKLNCIGRALPLHCQIHPNQRVDAQISQDFSKCPEGGCMQPCKFRLKCGHSCTRLCHPWDREHKEFKCQKECKKSLPCGHTCQRKCFECTERCAPCTKMVEKTIPKCGHKMMLPCHKNPAKAACTIQCNKILKCGHFCQNVCSAPCSSKCHVHIDKMLSCGHNANVPCYTKPEEIKCSEPCGEILQCEHQCKGTCGSCYQGRLHIQCSSDCGRDLVCGHICTFPCRAECPPCLNNCKNYCKHSKCPKKCYEPCVPCAEPCDWSCEHLNCTKQCGEICNRPPCNEACLKYLPCGHLCIGLCGEKCPKLCRECNTEEVTEIFFGMEDDPDARFIELEDCGHIFEYSGLDQWMKVQTNDPSEIQFKKCPKCQTLIRKSLRYANIVKGVQLDLEEIKKKQMADTKTIKTKLHDVKHKVENCEAVEVNLEDIEHTISSSTQYLFPHHLSAIQNQLNILPAIKVL